MAKINLDRQKIIFQMRCDGKTYEEIGKELGITRQAVHHSAANYIKKIKRRKPMVEKIIYQGIYDLFKRDVNMTFSKLSEIMGYSDSNYQKVANFIFGKSQTVRISGINNILKYLGEPYEKVFSLRTRRK